MRLERCNIEQFFNPNNLVTNYEIFKKRTELDEHGEAVRKFSDDGLFSKQIFGDMDAEEDYSCACRRLTGKFYEGCMCQKCETEVVYIGQSINRYGWIDCSMSKYQDGVKVESSPLGFNLIKYIPYIMLEKLIGRENLKNIILMKNAITRTGDLDIEEVQKIRDSDPKCKYWHIGLEEFYEKYTEVLDYYFQLNGKEEEIYREYRDRTAVFTDKIPVISIVLRPAMRTADGLKLDEININYQTILKDMALLKDPTIIPLIRSATLADIQAVYFDLSEKIIATLKSKGGLIRNQICGTRINFSARNIISPIDSQYGMDEVVVPYQTFLELYKFEIMRILRETSSMTAKEAERVWYNATLKFDEKIYLIMCKIIKDNEVGCLLNRNPTIALGSILYVKIAGVKRDFSDVTLSVSNLILSLVAGDYDGDVLNLISIKDKTTREVFKNVFAPTSLIVNPADGKFNNALNLERDQVLGLNSLITM